MSAKVYPANPTFRTDSEREVFEHLLSQLDDGDVIFTNLQIANDVEGDVEIDFLLLLKDLGVMVLEVKGGHITHDGYQWVQSSRYGSGEIDPAGQSKRNMYAVRNYITDRWSLGKLRIEWMVAFPQSNIVDPKDPALPISRIIQQHQLTQVDSSFRNILNAQRNTPLPGFDDWISVASGILQPVVALQTDPEAVLGNNYGFVRDLTHERETVLDQLADNLRYYVKGPAGSGKTWLAFMQAARWSAEGKKVAIVAFNRGLITYLERKNAELAEPLKVNWIGTFHGLAERMGTSAGAPGSYTAENDPYRANLIAKAEALSENQKFDAIVIDEAQDFLPSWWDVVELHLKNPATGQLALFGDDQQQIFGARPQPAGNFATLRLLENLRNSQQIAKAVDKFLNKPAIARGPNAFEVEYITVEEGESVFGAADDQVEKLVDFEEWKPKEIALLTTLHQHPEHKNRIAKDRLDHWRSLWEDDEVFYCTSGGFKGLERSVVVLAVDGFHDAVDPKDVLYVGMSRARDKLVVVAPAKEMEMIRSIQEAE